MKKLQQIYWQKISGSSPGSDNTLIVRSQSSSKKSSEQPCLINNFCNHTLFQKVLSLIQPKNSLHNIIVVVWLMTSMWVKHYRRVFPYQFLIIKLKVLEIQFKNWIQILTIRAIWKLTLFYKFTIIIPR